MVIKRQVFHAARRAAYGVQARGGVSQARKNVAFPFLHLARHSEYRSVGFHALRVATAVKRMVSARGTGSGLKAAHAANVRYKKRMPTRKVPL